MKRPILAIAVMAALASGCAHAEDKKPDNVVSFNAAATSDYRYRGISQTRLKPALQGGTDYSHNPSGFYAGAWLSTIKWTRDAGGDGDIELDLYAGMRGELVKDVSFDTGVLTYIYPSNGLANVAGFANANTTEIYGQLGYGPGYIKYSHSVTNLFGFVDSKNSGYFDFGANFDAGSGLTVNLHAGRQSVKKSPLASYTDWKIGVTKDLGVVTGALAVVGTNASKVSYASPVNGKFMGKNALILSLSTTF